MLVYVGAILVLLAGTEFIKVDGQSDDVTQLKDTVQLLAQQLMNQQAMAEQIVMDYGQSGLHDVRLVGQGTRPYHTASHSGPIGASALHDHANYIRTVGSGEFSVVLNGVKFRTRHNDFHMSMPSTNSSKYNGVEDIPFPDVPPEVLEQTSVEGQIAEMKEWFKAWKNQDYSNRDYRKYFKPVLCYLEGAWLNDTNTFEEAFSSERHKLDANSFDELLGKERYATDTGRKDRYENFAFLPTKVARIDEDGLPIVVQWNYRIMCHPLKNDLPLNRLRPVDDMAVRMNMEYDNEELLKSRHVRFTLNPRDSDEWIDKPVNYQLLDELMSEVPGKDNYVANVTDESYRTKAYKYAEAAVDSDEEAELNAGFYHRWVRAGSGALGYINHHNGFSDENLWVAMNTQERIAPIDETPVCNGVCGSKPSRVSYAIPLEIIYMTPLHSWNPHGLVYRGKAGGADATPVSKNGRDGSLSIDKAFNGTKSDEFYMTPEEFFSGAEVGVVPADTTKDLVGVLNAQGTAYHAVRGSGFRTILPAIQGVGKLRTRFPIFPVHDEGNNLWKELDAIKDVLLQPKQHEYVKFKLYSNTGAAPLAGFWASMLVTLMCILNLN